MPGLPPSHPDPLGDLSRRGPRDLPLHWLPSSTSSHLRSACTSVRSGLLQAVLDEKGLPPASHSGHPVCRAAVPLGEFKVAQMWKVGKHANYTACALFTSRWCLSCVTHVYNRYNSLFYSNLRYTREASYSAVGAFGARRTSTTRTRAPSSTSASSPRFSRSASSPNASRRQPLRAATSDSSSLAICSRSETVAINYEATPDSSARAFSNTFNSSTTAPAAGDAE